LVGVRSVDGVILEEIFGRVENRVIEIWDGLVSVGSGPLEELFEHLECSRPNKARDCIGGRITLTRGSGVGWATYTRGVSLVLRATLFEVGRGPVSMALGQHRE